MLEKVQKTIEKYSMLQWGDKVVIGVSGGPDSIVLLHVLHRLKEKWDLKLNIAYFNHMLRKEAIQEAEFVASYGEQLGLPVIVEKGDVASYAKQKGLSIQTAARELRYEFLNRIVAGTEKYKIALAHHLDDQAETVVIHFLRGPSPRGLAGIPPVRGKVIRPLIEVTRQEVEEYIKIHSLDYVDDPSNRENIYLRNQVRLDLMPILKTYNPNLANRLSKAAELFREEDSYLDEETSRQQARLCVNEGEDMIALSYTDYCELPLTIKRRLLRRCFLRLVENGRDLGFEQVEGALAWLEAPTRSKVYQLPKGIRLSYCGQRIWLSKAQKEVENIDFAFSLATLGSVDIPGGNLQVKLLSEEDLNKINIKDSNPWEVLINADEVKFPLTIRNRRPGDRFYPLGAGGSKKLKDFFIDLKLPRQMRGQVPLVVSALGQIIWVVGLRLDERFKVMKDNKNVLCISYRRKKETGEII